ncbi:MAG: hypothetical protein KIT09_26665 [Bryobacteraceae bacterium]|nr:hypothetical protein [Bryobacteraceae bacterium]
MAGRVDAALLNLATEMPMESGMMVVSETSQVVSDWDERQAILNDIVAAIREVAPAGYCIHGAPFCLSCALEWMVAKSVPVALCPEHQGRHAASAV